MVVVAVETIIAVVEVAGVAVVVSADLSFGSFNRLQWKSKCLRKQWVAVAHYFTAFHCQISVSETQNRSMRGKKTQQR